MWLWFRGGGQGQRVCPEVDHVFRVWGVCAFFLLESFLYLNVFPYELGLSGASVSRSFYSVSSRS